MPPAIRVSEPSTDPTSRRHAARIWAAATAFRDADPAPAATEEALPIIDNALARPGGALLLAEQSGFVVGFALVTRQDESMEVQYLGVDPAAWGSGVGASLLAAVAAHANRSGAVDPQLWVYEDNERAVRLYERAGWRRTDDSRRHHISHRRERRYVLPLP